MSNQPLILKNPKTKVKVYKNYLELFIEGTKYVISFIHIDEIYMNQNIKLIPAELLKISKKCPLHFIDHNGYVLGTLRRTK